MMKLQPDISKQDFKREMQVRACKYREHEKPIREAVRFARQHHDPEFYRIAIDKIDAQKQFHHELHGPSRWQKLKDYLGGKPKDVAFTLLIFALLLGGLNSARSFLSDQTSAAMSDGDVERLAQRMGLYISQQSKGERLDRSLGFDQQISKRIDEEIELAEIDQALTGKFSDVIERSELGKIASKKLNEELSGDQLRTAVTAQLERILDEPATKNKLVEHLAGLIDDAFKRQMSAEVKDAVAAAGIEDEISRRMDAHLERLDQQIAKRTSSVAGEVESAIERGIEQANLDRVITRHIQQYLTRLPQAAEESEDAAEQSSKATDSAGEKVDRPIPNEDDLVRQVANVDSSHNALDQE